MRDTAEILCREAARHIRKYGTRSLEFPIARGPSYHWHVSCWLSIASPTIIQNWLVIPSPAEKFLHGLASLQAVLETELHKAFDNAIWFRKYHQPRRLRQANLNSIASELADHRFEKITPFA